MSTSMAALPIVPNNPSLRTVFIHASSSLLIHTVAISSPTDRLPLLSTPATFAHSSPSANVSQRDATLEISSHPEMKRRAWAATDEEDEGELAVSVAGGWVRLMEDEGSVEFAPIQIQVDYILPLGGSVCEGLVFRREVDGNVPHMFLSPSSHQAARMWTPCIDDPWERCTWELEFTVPTSIQWDLVEAPVTVVSSGELMERTTHPHSPSKSIFYFLQANPISVQHVLFAVGPFERIPLQSLENKPIIGFCLPGDEEDVRHTTSSIPLAMRYFSTEFGVYPFSDYKMVFVTQPRVEHVSGAAVSIFSSDLLYPAEVLDHAFDSRQTLISSFIQQWLGINITPRSISDTWLVNGLALYLQAAFIRISLGNNEHSFRLKQDIDRCVRLDQGSKSPLCMPGSRHLDVPFINLKAPLVLHILNRQLVKAGNSFGLSRIIPRIFLSALSDELPGNTISTAAFFRLCRKVSGLDLQSFQEQWVYGSGCPRLKIQTNFVRKKFIVELGVQQFVPATQVDMQRRATPFFEGSLTVRIHEADGAPFEHVLDVKNKFKVFQLPFNTKYKRTKRSGRIAAKFNFLQGDSLADEDLDGVRVVADKTEVFSYPPWDDEEVRADWRVGEWNDDQAQLMMSEGSGYEWIRIDPDCEWLASIEYPEKPWFWISQLQGDRDVAAQIESIHNLATYPSTVVASELAKTVLVENYFYRVRVAAVKALIQCNVPDCDFIGSFLLVKLFTTLSEKAASDSANNKATYFVLKAIISAFADLKDPATRQLWPEVRTILLEMLKSADQGNNEHTNAAYIATAIASLGSCATGPIDKEVTAAVDRSVTMDRLIPSHKNVVTEAGLETFMKSIISGQTTNDPRLYLAYTREHNMRSIRIAAFDCLLLCKPAGRSVALAKYIFDVIRFDSSLTVRRHVAKALAESILMSLAVGEIGPPPSNLIDQADIDDEVARRQRADTHNKAIVKALRIEFEEKMEMRHMTEDLLKNSSVTLDKEIKFALLKLAEITVASLAEPIPGFVITLQTPIAEQPPIVPRIRLSISDAPVDQPPPVTRIILPIKKQRILPEQRSGLTEVDLKAVENALAKLVAHSSSFAFRQPVDPVHDGAPDYLSIVKEPMDLATARAKLSSGMYSNRKEFVSDVQQIVRNCFTYNRPGTPIYIQGQLFEAFFNNLWAKTEATLSSASGHPRKVDSSSVPVDMTPIVPQGTALKIRVKAPVSEGTSNSHSLAPNTPMAPPPLPVRKPSELSIHDMDRKKRAQVDETDESVSRKDLATTKGTGAPTAKKAKFHKKVTTPDLKFTEQGPIAPPIFAPESFSSHSSEHKSKTAEGDHALLETPPDLSLAATMPFKPKRAKQLIATLTKDPLAAIFLYPVDPIRDGCPSYLKEIKHPMDLSTISKKIESKRYKTLGQFGKDVELVFSNCRQFNPPGEFTMRADHVEALYRREWSKVISAKIQSDEKRAVAALLSRAMRDEISFFFREAVDPIALQIPTYFSIIPQEDARDLSLITRRFEKGKYQSLRHLDVDVELMLENARVFNGDGIVVDAANAFSAWWTTQREKIE